MTTQFVDIHMHIHYCIYSKREKSFFEWDEAKNRTNLRKHSVRFEIACWIFPDPYRLESFDTVSSFLDEDRWKAIGSVHGKILFVVYTEVSNDTVRIISARCASNREKEAYHVHRKMYN